MVKYERRGEAVDDSARRTSEGPETYRDRGEGCLGSRWGTRLEKGYRSCLGDFTSMKQYVMNLTENSQDGSFLRAVLAVRAGEYEAASAYIDKVGLFFLIICII